jgi:hypothetical protein
VQVRVDFVDANDARGSDHGKTVAYLEVQVTVAVMDLFDEVDDEGHHAAVTVAHLSQWESMPAALKPKPRAPSPRMGARGFAISPR